MLYMSLWNWNVKKQNYTEIFKQTPNQITQMKEISSFKQTKALPVLFAFIISGNNCV